MFLDSARKIFEALSNFVKDAGLSIQIIVTEHADDDVWGDINDSRIQLLKDGEGTKSLFLFI